jgi:hypothetical protein
LVTAADLMPFLALRAGQEENSVIRQFRAWVRQQMASGGKTLPTP